jgi:hypothetical protein
MPNGFQLWVAQVENMAEQFSVKTPNFEQKFAHFDKRGEF